jgi:hypothetical protein
MNRIIYYLLYHKFSVFFLTAAVLIVVVANEQLIKLSPSLKTAAMGVISKLGAKTSGLLEGGKDPVLHAWFGNGVIVAEAIREVDALKGDFTVEVIVKPAKLQGTHAHIIGNHEHKPFEGFVIQQEGDNQNVYTFEYGNGKKWLPGVRFKLAPEMWSYLAIVVKRNMIEVFRNGSLLVSTGATDSIKSSEMPVQVGNWANRDRPFKGYIYEVRILNSALLEDHIRLNWVHITEKLK